MTPEEARLFLRLDRGFDASDVAMARRRALKRHHPDHGGSRELLERVDQAVGIVLSSTTPMEQPPRRTGRMVQDCPSFTIDVLPVEAFEMLLLAAAALDADVADEEPPYVLEVLLRSPVAAWCRCEVVPEAGGSIVTLTSDIGNHESLDHLRDLWIDAINELQRP